MIISASCRHPSCLGKIEKRGNAGWMEETFGVLPQAGSLAAALGMDVDPSSKAPPIRDHNEKAAPAIAPKKRGLFDADLKNIAASDDESLSSSSDSDDSGPFKRFGVLPQVGSLAAALGMVVDPSSKAPPIRKPNDKALPAAAPKKRGLFDAALKKHCRLG